MARLRYERKEQHGFMEFVIDRKEGQNPSTFNLRLTSPKGEAKFELNTSSVNIKSLFFNTYFLDDGIYTFKLSFGPADDATKETAEGEVYVCNGLSAVACELRQAFRKNPDSALTEQPMDSTYFNILPEHLRNNNFPIELRSNPEFKPAILSEDQIQSFDDNGILVLEQFFDDSVINSAKQILEKVNDEELFGFQKGSSQRIVNLHESYKELNSIYSSQLLYDAVGDLFSVKAFPCQSLTFINGSTQDPHQDTVHLTPFPRGLMCGIWIAFEDVVEGAGELEFFKKSHKLPAVLCSTHRVPKVDSENNDYSKFGEVFTPQINNLLTENVQLKSEKFIAKAGDVLIWQENLIHGGSQRFIQDQTRMSMVIHAFGEPALIYYDSLGISGKRDTDIG